MASQRTHLILFALHSWAGIVAGVLLFVVCFSGAILVFKHEIDFWANPSLDLPAIARQSTAPIDSVLVAVAGRYPGSRPESIELPTPSNPGYYVFLRDASDARLKIAARADTGAVVAPVESQLGQFIRMLHVFLFFGPRWIVGALGVVMLVLIATGFFIHRKILKELFTLRWGHGYRLITADLHNALGVWGLLFHIAIAFTGAWLGLAPLFERAAVFVSGAPAAEKKAPKAGARTAEMVSLDRLVEDARRAIAGFEPRRIAPLRNWGRPDATVRIQGGLSDHLASTASITFSAATGEIRELKDPRERGFWSQVNGVMEPLHFGDFGGLWLKWLYFLLGLSPAFLSLSGTLMWIARRKQQRRRSELVGAAAHA